MLDRRRFLCGSGFALALPLLNLNAVAAAAPAPAKVKRLVAIGNYLGFHTPSLYPDQPGRDFQMTQILRPLEGLRDRVSLFSGLDHRSANGHKNWGNFLTGTNTPSVSFDQLIAEQIGHQTRYASLQLTCGTIPLYGQISFTSQGIHLPEVGRPSVLYRKLFRSDSDKARMDYLLESGQGVFSQVAKEAKSLSNRVGVDDRRKLDEYFSSVHDVEQKVIKQRAWLKQPTPQVDFALPEVDPIAPDLILECEELMYQLIALALQTDSTRVVSFVLPGRSQVFTIDGHRLGGGYHALSHHGNDPGKLADYNRIGGVHVNALAKFLRQLETLRDGEGRPLMDTTAVFMGSGMGDANTHNNSRLPAILAGGPFKHGAYHAIDRDNANSSTPLLGDLFLTIMQSMGLELDRFAKAKRNMNEYLL